MLTTEPKFTDIPAKALQSALTIMLRQGTDKWEELKKKERNEKYKYLEEQKHFDLYFGIKIVIIA